MEQKQAAVGMTKLDRENVYEWKKVKDRITTHLVEAFRFYNFPFWRKPASLPTPFPPVWAALARASAVP